MTRKLAIIVCLFVGLLILSVGFPHGSDPWFAYWLGSEQDRQTNYVLLMEYRIPEIVSAIIAGAGLSVGGLLLQTVLNNPLAGPSLLGLTSGSHLFVALVMLGGGSFGTVFLDFSITAAAALGSLAFGLLILMISIRLKSAIGLLLIGVMLGTFVSAFTSIVVANADPASLKAFTMWGFGSLQQLNRYQIPLFVGLFILAIIGALMLAKPLNALVLGSNQAATLGVNMKALRWKIIIVVALLTGLITAFCGPIGFVGLIVPNLVKWYIKTANHSKLIGYVSLTGALFLLFCVLLTRILEPIIVLPINTLMSLLGAPVVILIMLKSKNHD